MESFLHDLDGNMTSRTLAGQTTTYNWSAFDKMRQRKVDGTVKETNAFDAGGIRRLKRENGVSTRYFSSGAMSLADQSPTESVNFIQGHQILGMVQGGAPYYYITDGLSSCRVLVDVDGNEAASASYNEFGMPESVNDPNGLLNHGYVGGLGVRNETADNGLLYMRQRFYDPGLGRWLSEDPIGFSGGLNLQMYVGQNSINFSDPTGLDVYLWIRVQSSTGIPDWGHVWVEVDNPNSSTRYGAGAYPGSGLSTPEPYQSYTNSYPSSQLKSGFGFSHGGQDFLVAKVFHTSKEKDLDVIAYLKEQLAFAKMHPGKYYKIGGTKAETRVCSNIATRTLRQTGVDPNAPENLLEPNSIYNYYNPQATIPKGRLGYDE